MDLKRIANVCRVVGGSKTLGLLHGERERLIEAAELIEGEERWKGVADGKQAVIAQLESDNAKLVAALRNANGCIAGIVHAYGHTFTSEILGDLNFGLEKCREALGGKPDTTGGQGRWTADSPKSLSCSA